MPPYVVYKAANVYPSWRRNGPEGAYYSSTPSGWFDLFTFTDWFKKIFLPFVRRTPGKKVLIGDNLRSHLSLEVIQLCGENDIEFVCLPAYTTDKMQPLDVSVFGPGKEKWRQLLRALREMDPNAKALNKYDFPAMLKQLVEACNAEQNLPPGFMKYGLYPINENKVVERLPSIQNTIAAIGETIDSQLLKKLEVRRFGEKKKPVKRGTKLPASQSYCNRMDGEETEEEEEETPVRSKTLTKKKGKKTVAAKDSEEEEESEEEGSEEESVEESVEEDSENEELDPDNLLEASRVSKKKNKIKIKKITQLKVR